MLNLNPLRARWPMEPVLSVSPVSVVLNRCESLTSLGWDTTEAIAG